GCIAIREARGGRGGARAHWERSGPALRRAWGGYGEESTGRHPGSRARGMGCGLGCNAVRTGGEAARPRGGCGVCGLTWFPMNNQQFSDSGDRPAPRRRARRRVSRRVGSPSAAAVASASAVEAAEALRPSSRRSSTDATSYPTTGRDCSDQSGPEQSSSGRSGSGSTGPGAATTGSAVEPSEHPSPAHTIPTPPSVADAPAVAVAVTTSGIHPTTARLIALAAVYYDADGAEVGHFVQALNPSEDPGPWHMHGFDAGELAQQIGFATAAAEIK